MPSTSPPSPSSPQSPSSSQSGPSSQSPSSPSPWDADDRGLPFDTSVPHPARIYDFLLGGKNNFPADRAAAEEALKTPIPIRDIARANRAFLGRAVRFLAESGIRQFLDIGTGIPGPGNTGEVARAVHPDVRVVYVDHDPIVAVHSRALLEGSDPARSAVLEADVRDPAAILAGEQVKALIDVAEPVAVLMVSLLHFVPDEADPHGIVATFRDAFAPGSALALSHGGDFDVDNLGEGVAQVYQRSTSPLSQRGRADVERFFDGFDLVEPGLVQLPWWRPDGPDGAVPDGSEKIWMYAGVGIKPA
ncbi:MAG: SAM-dependent methyltransferase [Catenulispora sp.]|nr:SAM-dependent methyltransferase [Catenulispora sp.]